jgi:hypothetical protein
MRRNKNVSKKIPNGAILHTRDEYFHNEGKYRKSGYKNKGNYRKVVVIDSNRRDDLAVVKLHKSSGTELPSKRAFYKPIVETLDDENKRIRASFGKSGKFIAKGKPLSQRDVSAIKKDCFNNPKYRFKNRKKVQRIKNRNK